MADPRLVNGLEQLDGRFGVRITWDQGTGAGADLPAGYFAAVHLGLAAGTPITQDERIQSVTLSAQRELTVVFQAGLDPTALAQRGTLSFRLHFTDRREFIDCSHPGDDDQYFLDVALTFAADGSISNATLTESKKLGEI